MDGMYGGVWMVCTGLGIDRIAHPYVQIGATLALS